MANTLLTPSTLFLGSTSYAGNSAVGTVFNFSNSYFTNAQAYTDPDPANVGGITATNTSTTYFGSADPRYAENHGQDGAYLEVGEAIRIDINDNGSMTDDSWLRITTIAAIRRRFC